MSSESPKPNILWICTDQQRFDTIASLGNPHIRTPNLDRLVETGIALTHAYAQSPVCTPSRASFLTGRYPRTTRCRQNGQDIPPTEKLVTRILADEGYTCGLSGKLHLSSCEKGRWEQRIDDGYTEFYWNHGPNPLWYDDYFQWLESEGKSWRDVYGGSEYHYVKEGVPVEYHQTTWCAERAIDFIRRHNGSPWLFSVNIFDPHHPFDPPAEYLKRYNPSEMPAPKYQEGELGNKPLFQQLDHEWAYNFKGYFHTGAMTLEDSLHVTAAYYAMIELIDTQVGRMIATLEETGQYENTIVIFMSDHGEMLGDHGLYLKGPYFYEPAVRVPLIISWPARFLRRVRSDALVELVDVAPTLLGSAGVPVPAAMQGKSLLPICRGETEPGHHRDHVFCEYYNAMRSHQNPAAYATMVRTKDKKIVVHHGIEQGELYDLENDPDEFTNLWGSTAHTEMKMNLMKRAFDASVFTVDPLPERIGQW